MDDFADEEARFANGKGNLEDLIKLYEYYDPPYEHPDKTVVFTAMLAKNGKLSYKPMVVNDRCKKTRKKNRSVSCRRPKCKPKRRKSRRRTLRKRRGRSRSKSRGRTRSRSRSRRRRG